MWKITADYIENGRRIGTCSRDWTEEGAANVPLLLPFRMYDDDKNLYYEGVIDDESSGLEPLDDFGTPNAGCTMISIYQFAKWRMI